MSFTLCGSLGVLPIEVMARRTRRTFSAMKHKYNSDYRWRRSDSIVMDGDEYFCLSRVTRFNECF